MKEEIVQALVYPAVNRLIGYLARWTLGLRQSASAGNISKKLAGKGTGEPNTPSWGGGKP